MLGLMIWAEAESSMLLLSAPGCLLKPSMSVILEVHFLSENENPVQLLGCISKYTSPYTGCTPDLGLRVRVE